MKSIPSFAQVAAQKRKRIIRDTIRAERARCRNIILGAEKLAAESVLVPLPTSKEESSRIVSKEEREHAAKWLRIAHNAVMHGYDGVERVF